MQNDVTPRVNNSKIEDGKKVTLRVVNLRPKNKKLHFKLLTQSQKTKKFLTW